MRALAKYPELKDNPADFINMKDFTIDRTQGTISITYTDGRYPVEYKIDAIQKALRWEPKRESTPHNYNPGYEEFIFDSYEQYQKWKISKGIDEQKIEIFNEKTQQWVSIVNIISYKIPAINTITKIYSNVALGYNILNLYNKYKNDQITLEFLISKVIYLLLTSYSVGFVFDFILNEGTKGLSKLSGIPLEENWEFFNELYKGILAAAGANPSIHPKGKVKIRIEIPVINM